jgi:hypothetical protein
MGTTHACLALGADFSGAAGCGAPAVAWASPDECGSSALRLQAESEKTQTASKLRARIDDGIAGLSSIPGAGLDPRNQAWEKETDTLAVGVSVLSFSHS